MKTIALLLQLLPVIVLGQNLVPNGGFESYTSLPNDQSQWHFLTNWTNAGGTSVQGLYGDPDFFHLNGSGPAQLPHPPVAWVTPHGDSAIMGFLGYHDPSPGITEIREYVSVQLSAPLTVGVHYRVSFWTTNGDSGIGHYYKCNHIGALLSTHALDQDGTSYIPASPQMEIPGELFSNEWKQHVFYVTADSAYEYLTIGNFYSDAQTTKSVAVPGPLPFAGAYYFVDDVSMTVDKGAGVKDGDEALFSVSPNPVKDRLYIRLKQHSQQKVAYRLYALDGRVLREGQVRETAEVWVGDLSAGAYLMEVEGKVVRIMKD
jgi:hypothetical protein